MKSSCFLWLGLACAVQAGPLVMLPPTPTGQCRVEGAFTNGVVVLEQASRLEANPLWTPRRSYYSVQEQLGLQFTLEGPQGFYRVRAVDLSGGAAGFARFTRCYSILQTIAGAGGVTTADVNKWQPAYENGPATAAQLSRPHMAMGDGWGNIYIADKDAHGIRKIRPDGTIVTVAGTGLAGPNAWGNGPDYLTNGTAVALSHPNGLYVLTNGVVYILDMDNGKIRRLDTNGMMRTVFTDPNGPIFGGRGLWVSEDEQVVYYCTSDRVRRWTAADQQVTDFAVLAPDLGNITMDPQGRLVVTVRGQHLVYRFSPDGSAREVIAGNGTTGFITDGIPATNCPLYQVRGVAFLPTGAFLLATDRGSQVAYVDGEGIIYRLLNGDAVNQAGESHAGDGRWFYDTPNEYKVSEIRAIALDPFGNILITEHDAGYIRMIRFLPYDF
ncbi:hypothetical protein NXS98_17385 [Fontisphaera persica]|uniref:hypothetical protein n=1 Tax=Fontisphaera persica TaxID=2974023 RepID=UPI0024C01DA7|nr:hypothetical protein [Fontisphaera persica]WCJ59464.1 hypothetical protein NXS98_17385 [Fontisphaera persica]